MSLDDTPRCRPRLYEPAWTPGNGVPTFALCALCGRGTVRRDLHGVPCCHGPEPAEPRGWVLTRPGLVTYVEDALSQLRSRP